MKENDVGEPCEAPTNLFTRKDPTGATADQLTTGGITDPLKESDLYRILCKMSLFRKTSYNSQVKERISYCSTIKFSWRNYIHPSQLYLLFLVLRLNMRLQFQLKSN